MIEHWNVDGHDYQDYHQHFVAVFLTILAFLKICWILLKKFWISDRLYFLVKKKPKQKKQSEFMLIPMLFIENVNF